MAANVSAVEEDGVSPVTRAHSLVDTRVNKPLPAGVPFSNIVDRIRSEWLFQFRLARSELDQRTLTTCLVGVVATLMAGLNPEAFTGGDPEVAGWTGLMSASGLEVFLMLGTLAVWGWFFALVLGIYPIMRGHQLYLFIIWGCASIAQVFFHVGNPSFPFGGGSETLDLAAGGILTCVQAFIGWFAWTSVVDTRDLHVQQRHLSADVSQMEAEMAEHSLLGWGVLLIAWCILTQIHAWSGMQFVSGRNPDGIFLLIIHLLLGPLLIVGMMALLWFPQRMMGMETEMRTMRGRAVQIEMGASAKETSAGSARCPACDAVAPVSIGPTGHPVVRCAQPDCGGEGDAGTSCMRCSNTLPTRLQCEVCGVNAPVMDFIPESEAW